MFPLVERNGSCFKGRKSSSNKLRLSGCVDICRGDLFIFCFVYFLFSHLCTLLNLSFNQAGCCLVNVLMDMLSLTNIFAIFQRAVFVFTFTILSSLEMYTSDSLRYHKVYMYCIIQKLSINTLSKQKQPKLRHPPRYDVRDQIEGAFYMLYSSLLDKNTK